MSEHICMVDHRAMAITVGNKTIPLRPWNPWHRLAMNGQLDRSDIGELDKPIDREEEAKHFLIHMHEELHHTLDGEST